MKVTRENHAHYMGRLAPLLLLGYVAQTWAYYHYLSPALAYDISVFLGIGLFVIAAAFLIHDHCYVATLHENYLEVRFRPFPIHEEILYRDIEDAEVFTTKLPFSHLKLTTDEGKTIWLYNVDNAHNLAETIKNRRYR